MSTIDKMLIKGIRSFSPDNANVIEFYKPLTLIVGHNGAGKTTIIECLKMACTGELPPNTRSGQSFIHDPKVAGETEVKAQIKLRFRALSSQPFIVIRSFQLSQKKSGLQFKALDNTLQTHDSTTGQMVALPYRCGEINTQVPAYMGVTKAVLENVIFVHQEDSNWPLAETQVLKRKFDDIFAATKYTKALEELRKLRLREAQAAKEMKLKLETLKTHRDHAARLRQEAAGGAERAASLRCDIASMQGKAAKLAEARAAVDAKLAEMADYNEELLALQARHSMLSAKNAEAYARLVAMYPPEDLAVSEEDLQACAAQVAGGLDTSAMELGREERNLNSKERLVEALRDQRDREGKTHGRLVAEEEAHQRNLQERDRFLRRVCAEAGAAPPPGDDGISALDAPAAAAFRQSLQKELATAGQVLAAARSTHQRDDDARGREVDRLAGEISGGAEGLRMKQEQMRANTARMEDLRRQHDAAGEGNRDALEALRGRQRATEARLEAKEEELAASPLEAESRQHGESLITLATRAEALRSERAFLASAAEEASRMNYKAQELKVAEEQAAALLAAQRGGLAVTLDVAPGEVPSPGQELLSRVQTAMEARRQEAAQRSATLEERKAAASAADGSLQATQAQLHRARSELQSLAARLQASASASGAAVSSQLVQLEEERANKCVKINEAQSFVRMYKRNVKVAIEHNNCATCLRPFESPQQAQAFVTRIQGDIARMPSSVEAVKAQVAQLEAKVAALKELEPVAARHDSLREKEVPELEQRVAQLEDEATSLKAAVEAAAAAEEEASQALKDAQAALQDGAGPLTKLAREVEARRSEVDNLRATMRVANATRSVSDVDAELAAVEAERAQHEAAREAAGAALNRMRDEVSSLRTEVHRAREEFLRLSAAAEKRAALEVQLAELSKSSETLSAAVVEARRAVAPLEARRAELAAARDAARTAARAEEARLEEALRALQTWETQVDARERALAEYTQRGGAAALATGAAKVDQLVQQLTQAEAECRVQREKLARMKTQAAEQESFKRQITDIIAFRRSKAQEEALSEDMDAKGVAQAAVGDRPALQNEYRRLEAEEAAARSEADRCGGALATVTEAAERAAQALRGAEYRDIDERWRRDQIEVRMTEMAAGDLEKYHKALERALLSFHTTKMADINAIVKELWQKTYRGSDIDYIAIRADTEGTAARSYNYRVVMSCGGAELDMRGRSSAGQKVLACLIIRLALAETFCLHCGILALDEPTTNLDADNAASLAEALRAIMATRREQENFQLVVITHDEAFARQIGTREHAEFMWRITKDDAQHSTVLKEGIMD